MSRCLESRSREVVFLGPEKEKRELWLPWEAVFPPPFTTDEIIGSTEEPPRARDAFTVRPKLVFASLICCAIMVSLTAGRAFIATLSIPDLSG